ncbi:4Fe-4S dicluster domain-containing protein [Thermococcus sp.]|uniref:4Fe-4S dicluster domain-containing protein n=1 Tax=Thermococcus sp. TaxID=35749 RepID=UPI0019C62B7F|nr:4Fe-4S dicluster domain-containing protein [Thermococcus sp.]MBC7095400.1 4Fe-4S dicluster domain-containing protein [Thermococcus sp.]
MGRLKLIAKAISIGRVTEKYPFLPIEVPEKFRGKPVIDPEKCIGCSACANACPPQALQVYDDLERELRIVHLFIGRCIFCARCEDVCPTEAIKLTKEFELATLSEEDLHQFVELKMARCEECGKPFDTFRHILHSAKELPPEQRSLMLLCPECRTKRASRELVFGRGGGRVV